MSWIVAPKNVQLSGKAMLTQKLAAVLGRLSGCRKMHDMWRSDALICKSELENISVDFRFELGSPGVSKIAASCTAIRTAVDIAPSNFPRASRFVKAAMDNISKVSTAVSGVDPSEASTLEIGMESWAEQLAEARSQMPDGIDWNLD